MNLYAYVGNDSVNNTDQSASCMWTFAWWLVQHSDPSARHRNHVQQKPCGRAG
jgi:hypothetical protein